MYLKDEDKVIDVELQAHPRNALGKRARYYQSMIDVDCLMKGQPYTKLKDSYILFICKFDPFYDNNKKAFGLPCYTFQSSCVENDLVNLDDNCVKVVYNAKAYENAKDSRVRSLLKFIQTNEPGEDEFSKRLSDFVIKIKENEKFRKEYADMNLHDYDIMTEAKEEGRQEKTIEDAQKLLSDGKYTAEEISALLQIPVEAFSRTATISPKR